MRCSVMVLAVMASCYGRTNSAPPASPSRPVASRPRGPELDCPEPGTRKLRGVEPEQGGYRVLEHDGELEAARTAMAAGVPDPSPEDGGRAIVALSAAMSDLRPELVDCMVEADGAHPALQYQLGLSITGNSIATMITNVTLKRTDGIATGAEACVKELLTRLELPPSSIRMIGETPFRQDFCTPTVTVAKRMTQSYVGVYLEWLRDRGSAGCPATLADLASRRDNLRLRDPWAQPYVMRCTAKSFQILSAGPDRTLGTPDDLESHR